MSLDPRTFSVLLRKPVYLNRLRSSKSLVQIEETFKVHLLQKMTKTFYDRGFTCNSILCNLCYTLGVFISYRSVTNLLPPLRMSEWMSTFITSWFRYERNRFPSEIGCLILNKQRSVSLRVSCHGFLITHKVTHFIFLCTKLLWFCKGLWSQ